MNSNIGNRIGQAFVLMAVLAGCSNANPPEVRLDKAALPVMRWDHRPEADAWTAATLSALKDQGSVLLGTVPTDIADFCPAYENASERDRAAFWSGLFSALAKHESTWKPQAAGGDGKWIGLTQIAPATARAYGCHAQNASKLKNGSANLSCAVRIAAAQVGRDGVLVSQNGNWRGLARDWAPLRNPAKREDMANWTRAQDYCVN